MGRALAYKCEFLSSDPQSPYKTGHGVISIIIVFLQQGGRRKENHRSSKANQPEVSSGNQETQSQTKKKTSQHPRLSLVNHNHTDTHAQIATNKHTHGRQRQRQRQRLLQNHCAWTSGCDCGGQPNRDLECEAEGRHVTLTQGRGTLDTVCGPCCAELMKNSGTSLNIKRTAAEVPTYYFCLPNLRSHAA